MSIWLANGPLFWLLSFLWISVLYFNLCEMSDHFSAICLSQNLATVIPFTIPFPTHFASVSVQIIYPKSISSVLHNSVKSMEDIYKLIRKIHHLWPNGHQPKLSNLYHALCEEMHSIDFDFYTSCSFLLDHCFIPICPLNSISNSLNEMFLFLIYKVGP